MPEGGWTRFFSSFTWTRQRLLLTSRCLPEPQAAGIPLPEAQWRLEHGRHDAFLISFDYSHAAPTSLKRNGEATFPSLTSGWRANSSWRRQKKKKKGSNFWICHAGWTPEEENADLHPPREVGHSPRVWDNSLMYSSAGSGWKRATAPWQRRARFVHVAAQQTNKRLGRVASKELVWLCSIWPSAC